MKNLNSPLFDIKIRDIQILIELQKTKSLRELARRLNTTPGQLSKIIKNLEYKLGVTLLNRSLHGVEPTPESLDLLPYLSSILESHQHLQGELKKDHQTELLSFASNSFISTHLLPKALSNFKKTENTRFRLLSLPPNQFIPIGLRNGFQICIHLGQKDWPKTWTSACAGEIRWDLYCRTKHPLSLKPQLKSILKYPFLYPVYWSSEGIQFGDDKCPLNIKKRIRGHETATATAAAEFVASTDQLAFLPHVLVDSYLSEKKIRKLPITEWKPVTQKVFLTVKNDFVKQSTFKYLISSIGDFLT